MFSKHLLIIALASTTEVVVPSPASLAVFCEACFKILQPKFSIGSVSIILLATVTPSFVICGFPYSSSIITVLPEAPRVEDTASAKMSIPLLSFSRPSPSKTISFSIILYI